MQLAFPEIDAGVNKNNPLKITIKKIVDDTATNAEPLSIEYEYYELPFGKALLANTNTGLCFLHFEKEDDHAFHALEKQFPKAILLKSNTAIQAQAIDAIHHPFKKQHIVLHVLCSDFQFKVWNALTAIPFAALSTYQDIATTIGQAKAARAVGTAIGANPVAMLIPCHRIVQKSGKLGGYFWGLEMKKAILNWEQQFAKSSS